MREPESRADADELRDADAEVRDEHRGGREERPARPVLLADQLGEALAGDRAHPRGHLLHDDEADRDQHHHPEQVVAVARSDGGVGRDAARVVAGVRGDDPRAEEREERDELDVEPVTRPEPGAAAGQARQAVPERHVSRPRGDRSGAASVGQDELEHVVDGDDPEDALVLVDDRDDGQVEVGHQPRDLLEVGVGADGLHGPQDVPEPLAPAVRDEIGERDPAAQAPVRVHAVDPRRATRPGAPSARRARAPPPASRRRRGTRTRGSSARRRSRGRSRAACAGGAPGRGRGARSRPRAAPRGAGARGRRRRRSPCGRAARRSPRRCGPRRTRAGGRPRAPRTRRPRARGRWRRRRGSPRPRCARPPRRGRRPERDGASRASGAAPAGARSGRVR